MHFFTAPINSSEPSLQKMFKKSIIPITYLSSILDLSHPNINKTLYFHMGHPFHCSKSAVGQSVCVIRARQCHRTGHSSCYLFLNKCCFRQNIHNIKYKDWYYIGILQSAVRTTQVFADLIAPDFFSCRNSTM